MQQLGFALDDDDPVHEHRRRAVPEAVKDNDKPNMVEGGGFVGVFLGFVSA